MKTICTKCGSDEIYLVEENPTKEPQTQTLDEMAQKMNGAITLVYKMKTWACKKCGYSVSV